MNLKKNLVLSFHISTPLIFIFFFLTLQACSLLQRSEQSGYSEEESLYVNDVREYYKNKYQYEKDLVKQELALPLSRPLSENERKKLKIRLHLKRLERQLVREDEKKQYYHLKPFFKSDADRIRFLMQPNTVARKRWADQRGITTNESKFSPIINQLIENNDITLGMSKNAVLQSWGEPDYIEVAGNEIYGNERWNYIQVRPTPEGYKRESRIIYFESSRVAGWETQKE